MSHYTKAPITEALIDIQFEGEAVSATSLTDINALEADQYPTKRPLYISSITLDGGSEQQPPITKHTDDQMGWAFISANKLQVWQARRNGFTFSRLAPYEQWDSFRDEARRLWKITRDAFRPETITRIGVRYINRIVIPLPLKDFKDYLLTVPEIAPSLTQSVSSFFMQLHIPQEDILSLLVLNQQLIPPRDLISVTSIPIVLDIDLFRFVDIPQEDDKIWELFELLRTKKNNIFEGCITDATRELIR